MIAVAVAVAGTALQFSLAMQQLNAQEREAARTFRIVDDWRQEIPWRNPVRRARQRRASRLLLEGSLHEAAR